jgi:stearoyl-CoA desaturase (delta-9 desaturase)
MYLFQFLDGGLLDLSLWQLVVATLLLTHVTIAGVTIYLHRAQAHRALDLHPGVSHFFRAWLWLTTGMQTREWVSIHRKHHAKCETAEDPHSPQTRGLNKVLWEGAELYMAESQNAETLAKYSHGTPNDWAERNVYSRFTWHGCGVMLGLDLILFGAAGLAVWGVQMMWIPFLAAGVINGIGHFWGYRNFDAPDASTNIVPWGILIGGEELHNNHHTYRGWRGCCGWRPCPRWPSPSRWWTWTRCRRWWPTATTCWRAMPASCAAPTKLSWTGCPSSSASAFPRCADGCARGT